MSILWIFWVGFCLYDVICSCNALHLHFHNVSCIIDVCLYVETCVLLGLDWVEPMMHFSLHVTCSCIVHAYVPFHFHIWYSLLMVFFCFSLSLIVCAWHPCAKPLHLGTFFVSGLLLLIILFTFGFVMRRLIRTSQRTSLNVAFIWNTAWFYWTFLILLYPLSFIVGD